LIAFGRIQATFELAVILGVALLIADVVGWRVIAPLFDRERLISRAH
jgi:hypothetical protein